MERNREKKGTLMIQGQCKEALDKTEWVAIVTWGEDGPHVVATWGDYVRTLGIKDNEIRIPAYSYYKTEENLSRESRVELLIASKGVQRSSGKFGQGYRLSGRGEIQTSGDVAELAKAKFSGVRGALVVKVEETKPLL